MMQNLKGLIKTLSKLSCKGFSKSKHTQMESIIFSSHPSTTAVIFNLCLGKQNWHEPIELTIDYPLAIF